MKVFKDNLKLLVESFATFNSSNKQYVAKKAPDDKLKQQIEIKFIELISYCLALEGIDEEKINSQYRKLAAFLHPDRLSQALPEIIWLESVLKVNQTDAEGACFKLLQFCADNLKKPKEEKNEFFEKVDSWQALIDKVKRWQECSSTFTEKAFYASIIALISEAKKHNQTTSRIPENWTRRLFSVMPYVTSGYCLTFFYKELALLYGVNITLVKTGKWLESSRVKPIHILGKSVRQFSGAILEVTGIFLSRLTELNVLFCHGFTYLGVEAGKNLYSMLTYSKEKKAAPQKEEASHFADRSTPEEGMILKLHNLLGGEAYDSEEIKCVAFNLEQYRAQAKDQFFLSLRKGQVKVNIFKEYLKKLKIIDNLDEPLNKKLELIEEVLEELKKRKEIDGHSEQALDDAMLTLEYIKNSQFSENNQKQLVACAY